MSANKANTVGANLDRVQAPGFVQASYPAFSSSNWAAMRHNHHDNFR